MKIVLNPLPALRTAPSVVRLAYLGLFAQAVALAATGVRSGSIGWGVAAVFGGYVTADTGLALARGRKLGHRIAVLLSAALFALHFARGTADLLHLVGAAAAGGTLVLLFLPGMFRHLRAHAKDPLMISKRRPSPAAPAIPLEPRLPQDHKPALPEQLAAAEEDAKAQAVAQVQAQYGRSAAKAAERVADKVLGNQADLDKIDLSKLNRAERRAVEKARRTGGKPTMTKRVPR